MTRAVVFAYHNVGVRCLAVLAAQGVDIALVVTHEDQAQENIWFASVAQWAAEHDVPCITPAQVDAAVVAQVAACAPDLVFSFYYRNMLPAAVLACPRLGAYNMHGSLLPKYRGRVPVNWAVLHGETETGASLHVMEIRPDAGALVDQMAVPILPEDSAQEVFQKVTLAAEMVLQRSLPALCAGQARLQPQDLSLDHYFGGRKAEDGRFNADIGAQDLHNLVRAVTHPYPGAFIDTAQGRLVLWRTRVLAQTGTPRSTLGLEWNQGRVLLHTKDGGCLQVLAAQLNDQAWPDAWDLGSVDVS